MKTILFSLIVLGAFTVADRAVAEPFELNAAQMDSVTGGPIVHLVLTAPSGQEEIVVESMAPFEGDIMIGLRGLIPAEPGMGMVVEQPLLSMDIHPPSPR